MSDYAKGKVVLVPFPFTDLSASKVRPAVIVSDNLAGDDVVVAFISSQKPATLQKTDILLDEGKQKFFRQTGLKTTSVIKIGKLATLEKKIIIGELGTVDSMIQKETDRSLKILFGI